MVETLFMPIAWGSPGGTGFIMISTGILFWGIAQFRKAGQK